MCWRRTQALWRRTEVPLKDFDGAFADELRPDFAAAYLAATLEDGIGTFLMACVTSSRQRGMADIARAAELNRRAWTGPSRRKAILGSGAPQASSRRWGFA